MTQLYMLSVFLSFVQIIYGIWCFRRLGTPHRVYIAGVMAAFGLWLFSYVTTSFNFVSKQPLHYVTPVLGSMIQAFFYKAALKSYSWSRFLPLLPVFVVSYIAIDLYLFGQRKMAIDLMSYVNVINCMLGVVLQNDLLKQTGSELKRNGLLWLNSAILLSALLGVLSNLLLSRLFQYQNNEYFLLLYYGFWPVMGLTNTGLVTYSIFLDSRKLPSLDQMPGFDR